MPKSYLEEAVAWLTEREEEAKEDMLSAESREDFAEFDYNQGRFEAYGVARSRIQEMLNGKD